MLTARQIEIAKAWYATEDLDDDISTERLTAITCDKTGASWNDVMEAMNAFSETLMRRQANTGQNNRSAIEAILKEGK